MLVILTNTESYFDEPLDEEVVPIVWNCDPNLLIGEAAVTFDGDQIYADAVLFDDLAPIWFIDMLHDCPDCWGTTSDDQDTFMLGVMPPTETDLTMLIIEKFGEFHKGD